MRADIVQLKERLWVLKSDLRVLRHLEKANLGLLADIEQAGRLLALEGAELFYTMPVTVTAEFRAAAPEGAAAPEAKGKWKLRTIEWDFDEAEEAPPSPKQAAWLESRAIELATSEDLCCIPEDRVRDHICVSDCRLSEESKGRRRYWEVTVKMPARYLLRKSTVEDFDPSAERMPGIATAPDVTRAQATPGQDRRGPSPHDPKKVAR